LAKQHFLLIDDAQLFAGQDDYPTMEFLRETCATMYDCFEVEHDVIRIYNGAHY
jgi:hypothetical protein